MSNCMKTYTMGFKLFHGGRWMDVSKLKITLQFLQQRLKTGNILITNGLESRFKDYSFKTATVLSKITSFITIILN
jgi:hypothetical protein